MARFKDRQRAITLRLHGATYREIREELKVSKGTLALWLRNVVLSTKQTEKINLDAKRHRVEAYLKTTKERRTRIFNEYVHAEKKYLGKISKRDLFVAGLFLYLGEGSKTEWFRTTLSNSDPAVIRFWTFWLQKIMKINPEKIGVYVHLYKDMDIESELKFWSEVVGLPKKNFRKPYIKKTTTKKINHWSHGHGTCNLVVGDVKLKHRIMAGIRILLETARPIIGHVV